jgi:hypothetical protein
MSVVFTANYFFSERRSQALLVTDFVNLRIKLTQSFRGAHMCRMCVRVFIGVGDRTRMSMCF